MTPMLQLCRMYETESANGNRYFRGRLNGCRVLLFRDRQADAENQWTLFLQEAPAEQQSEPAQPAARKKATSKATRPQRPAATRTHEFDDALPF